MVSQHRWQTLRAYRCIRYLSRTCYTLEFTVSERTEHTVAIHDVRGRW